MGRQHRLLAALLLSALAPLPRLAAQESAPATKKGLFWKATSGGNTVYLVGSIHVGSNDMYPLPKEYEEAFNASKTLIVEVNINKVDMQKMQSMVLARGMYSGEDSLWNHVGPDVKTKLEAFGEKYQMPAMVLAKMKPWLVSVTIAMLPMMKAGMDPNLGIDKHFIDEAAAANKTITELETAEWQMNLLSGFSDEVQAKELASAIEQANKSIDRSKQIEELWRAGDAEKVNAALREDAGPPEVEQALLTGRNPHMADIAEQYLKGKDQAFLVVGAAHLVGKDGVVSLLEKRGYKVQQVALGK